MESNPKPTPSQTRRGSYIMGVDFGTDEGTAITIMRRPNWFEKLLRRLKLSKAVWEYKIIHTSYERSPEALPSDKGRAV